MNLARSAYDTCNFRDYETVTRLLPFVFRLALLLIVFAVTILGAVLVRLIVLVGGAQVITRPRLRRAGVVRIIPAVVAVVGHDLPPVERVQVARYQGRLAIAVPLFPRIHGWRAEIREFRHDAQARRE